MRMHLSSETMRMCTLIRCCTRHHCQPTTKNIFIRRPVMLKTTKWSQKAAWILIDAVLFMSHSHKCKNCIIVAFLISLISYYSTWTGVLLIFSLIHSVKKLWQMIFYCLSRSWFTWPFIRQTEDLINEVRLLRHQNKWSYLEYHFTGLSSVDHLEARVWKKVHSLLTPAVGLFSSYVIWYCIYFFYHGNSSY